MVNNISDIIRPTCVGLLVEVVVVNPRRSQVVFFQHDIIVLYDVKV